MPSKIRKYKLNTNKLVSRGIGSEGDEKIHNLLSQFTYGDETYNALTINDLRNLSSSEYIRRVESFLRLHEIETPSLYDSLRDGSQDIVDEGICGDCILSNTFIVKKFFNGIRVGNYIKNEFITNVNYNIIGKFEFKVYVDGTNESDASWQTRATFLGLDFTETYVVAIRYVINQEVCCMVNKTVSLDSIN